MTISHSDFAAACTRAFAFLQARFGFSSPEIEYIGREAYVRFHKADRTVSVSREWGGSPIVELFHPVTAEGTEPPVPWAARNGVQRTIRFPELRYRAEREVVDESDLASYLSDLASQLEQLEHEWLAA